MTTVIICSIIMYVAYRNRIDTIPASMLTFAVMLALNPSFVGVTPVAMLAAAGITYLCAASLPVVEHGLHPFAIMAVMGNRRIGLRFEAVTI